MDDKRTDIDAGTVEKFRDAALAMAGISRSIITAAVQRGFDIEKKPDGSYLTSVDLAVEQQLRRTIAERFPDHGIAGEEFPPRNPAAPYQWIMDPIDGTEDFAQGIPTFGSILALYYHGLPVIGVIDHPLLDIRAWASFRLGTYKNNWRVRLADLPPPATDGSERVMLSARANFIRYRDDGPAFDAVAHTFPNGRIYRTCYAHLCAATGSADAMVAYHDRLWDIAASRILVEEAGGKYVQLQELDTPDGGKVYSVVFGKPALVDRLVNRLRE